MSLARRRKEAIQAPTEDMWNAYKELLRGLYFNSTLAEVIKHMEEDYGFIASKNQYERKFKDWNFRKNLTIEEREHILRKKRKRDREGKDTAVDFHGVKISNKRLKKEESRYALSELEMIVASCSNAPSPPGVTVSTPTSLVLDYLKKHIKVNNLPCFNIKILYDMKANQSPLPAFDDNTHLLDLYSSNRKNIHSPFSYHLTTDTLISRLLRPPIGTSDVETQISLAQHLRNATIEEFDGDFKQRVACIFGQSEAQRLQEIVRTVIQVGSNNMMDDWGTRTILDWVTEQDRRLLTSLFNLENIAVQASLENFVSSARSYRSQEVFRALVDADKKRTLFRGRRERLLLYATELECGDVVEDLLNNEDLDVNRKFFPYHGYARDSLAKTLLGITSDLEIAKMLIEAGADMNNVVCDGVADFGYGIRRFYPPIYRAICEGRSDLFKLFLDKGARFDETDFDSDYWYRPGMSLLGCAIERGSIGTVRLLLEQGVEYVDSLFHFNHFGNTYGTEFSDNYRTEFQQACYLGDMEIVRAILDTKSGSQILTNSRYKWAPLRDAASAGHLNVVELLIAAGADVNGSAEDHMCLTKEDHKIDRLPASALMAAVVKGHIDVVQSLLGHGADISGSNGANLLAVAELTHEYDIASLLELSGVNRQVIYQRRRDLQRLYHDLQSAASRRDLTTVRELLASGIQPNHMLDYSSSDFEEAGLQLKKNVLLTFLEVCGCQVNTKGPETNVCAVELAIEVSNVQLLQRLANAMADFNIMTSDHVTPLQLALSLHGDERYAVVACLLQHGADINVPAVYSPRLKQVEAPIIIAVSKFSNFFSTAPKFDPGIVELLLRTGKCDLTAAGQSSILVEAFRNRELNTATIDLLLEHGADVNADDQDGTTPLIVAVYEESIEKIHFLLLHGANVNPSAGYDCGTALSSAIAVGSVEISELLLDNGADINAFTSSFRSYGSTPLQVAVELGRVELTELLLARGADINAPAGRDYERTALQWAIAMKTPNVEQIEMLIGKGADINAQPAAKGGVTALQAAAILGHLKIALMLLELGADPNAIGSPEEGRTALEGAAEHGRLDMVQLLLNAGAEPSQSAVDYAEKERHFVVADMIKAELHNKQANDKGKGKGKGREQDMLAGDDIPQGWENAQVWDIDEDMTF
ncbi:hypothetical protein VTL71DRAFT_13093 [Oculimacula yallundae]|uniref:Clr5 domain-containing protein n=1 Tax=Oculimacula yallundae TaxID=86028 RepID=A0ABR4CR50_9HELO